MRFVRSGFSHFSLLDFMKNSLLGVDFKFANGGFSSRVVRTTAGIIAVALFTETSFSKAIG